MVHSTVPMRNNSSEVKLPTQSHSRQMAESRMEPDSRLRSLAWEDRMMTSFQCQVFAMIQGHRHL